MIEFADIFRTCLMHAGVAALLAAAIGWVACRLARLAKADFPHRPVFALFAIGLAIYAGAKHATGVISYPFTDSEVRYLTDNGSYVTNDYVHVSFTTILVPSTANLYIDRRRLDQTNDTDWVHHVSTTIGAFVNPQDLAFTGATNWNWMVYTDWTPGPSVVTNGVLHANWGKTLNRAYVLPVRTTVIVDGEREAPPVTNATNTLLLTTPLGDIELDAL